jgi:hypothetical protein
LAKFKKIGKTVRGFVYISSADGNSATALTISLPIAPYNDGMDYAVDAQQKVNTALSRPYAHILSSGSVIAFDGLAAASDGNAFLLRIFFEYEVL